MTLLNDGSTCPAASECVAYSDIVNYASCCSVVDQLCCTQEVIEQNLSTAIDIVERITSTTICPYSDCKLFNGDGSSKLYFSPVTSLKLLSVTSITLDACNPEETLCATEDPTNFSNWLEYKCGETFPCGSNNIKVCGSWGSFATVPTGLKEAIIIIALEKSQPGIMGIETSQGLVDSVTWDDFSINYNTADVDVSIPSTGFVSIDRLLQAYIPTSSQIKFAVAEGLCPKSCCDTNTKDCKQC